MNCAQAKKIDLVSFLAELGYFPAKRSRRGNEYWYLSPLRNEQNPSFHVDSDKNIWYDHGSEQDGGTIIDFGMRYYRCDISDVLKKLEEYVHYNPVPNTNYTIPVKPSKKEKKIIVLSTGPIASPALFYYLNLRKIPADLAQIFCCEIKYQLYDKHYYAIGFKNDIGGYEIRNKGFKGSSMPKGITFINRGFNKVEVFEGFFSFLSFLVVIKYWEQLESNFLILNSVSFFKKSRELMEKHELSNLHLDRDNSGLVKTLDALNTCSKYRDASIAYYGFKDWNKYLLNEPSQIFKIKKRPLKTFCNPDVQNASILHLKLTG